MNLIISEPWEINSLSLWFFQLNHIELQEHAENSFVEELTEPEDTPVPARNATAVTYRSNGETFSLDCATHCIYSML